MRRNDERSVDIDLVLGKCGFPFLSHVGGVLGLQASKTNVFLSEIGYFSRYLYKKVLGFFVCIFVIMEYS